MLRRATVRVPCSTSNLGAGFDCIGLAFQRYLQVSFIPDDNASPTRNGGGLRLEYSGTLPTDAATERDIIVRAFGAQLARHGVERVNGVLRATSEIPVARGLGSSAAATVAGLMLAELAVGEAAGPASSSVAASPFPLDRADLLRTATEREGHPDNAAPALLGGLVAVVRDEHDAPHAFRLALSPDIGFVYAAPELEVATPAARAALPANVAHSTATRALGRMGALVHGLASGDPQLLRAGLLDELHVPYRLPLIPRSRETMAAAVAAGAYGATISGSGSGIIALCPRGVEADVLAAMQRELAADGVATTGFAAEPDTCGAQAAELEAAC